MANEEAFLVVIGVNEPAGDSFSAVASHFTGLRVEHVYAIDLHLDLVVLNVSDIDIRLT